MKVLERWYVKARGDDKRTMSFASKIQHEGSPYPSWYPSNQLTAAQAAYIISNPGKFFFNIKVVPEAEQEVPTRAEKTAVEGTFKKNAASYTESDAGLDALFGES